MFHGCVSYAIDIFGHAWASGSGVDSESARTNALSRLGTPASFVVAQCSDPPGVIRFGSPTAPAQVPTTEQLRATSLPGTDYLGWTAYPHARCDSGNQPVCHGPTTKSVLVVCQIQPGDFYYRGVRLNDGASIELANAVRSSEGFDVTNPTDGTIYRIRPTSLTIAPPDGAASSEPMLQYASS
jgi:serine/threonine-protein kinase